MDLLTFIETLEKLLQKQAIKKFVGMQAGDVKETYADISKINNEYGFLPNTEIKEGLKVFVEWYMSTNYTPDSYRGYPV